MIAIYYYLYIFAYSKTTLVSVTAKDNFPIIIRFFFKYFKREEKKTIFQTLM